MVRSCVNHVAHELVAELADPTWRDLRAAIDTARIAVEACDLYRDLWRRETNQPAITRPSRPLFLYGTPQ